MKFKTLVRKPITRVGKSPKWKSPILSRRTGEVLLKYTNPRSPASLGGIQRLQKSSKLNRKKLADCLTHSDAYTRHKERRFKFPRNAVVVLDRFSQVQADLMDVSTLSYKNKAYKFILVVIDCFSRKIYCEPIKRKTGTEVSLALGRIFDTFNRNPDKLQVDRGWCNESTQKKKQTT